MGTRERVRRSLAARGLLWGIALLASCGDSDEGGDGTSSAAPSATASSDLLFREEELNDFHLTMAPSDWDSIIGDTMGDTYRRTSFQWKNVTMTDVAIRPAGGGATRFPGNQKMSVKLDFNEFVPGRKFMGVKSLKLDGLLDPTMMRERISYGVFRAWVPAAPRAVHGRLFVNGAYRGLYLVEERVREDLLKHRYGEPVGNLYHLRVEVPEAFTWRGADPALYLPRPWEPETHEADGDHGVIPRFLDVLNHRPEELASVCDTEHLTAFLALEAALISRDGLLRDDGPPQNHYAYHRPQTGLFEFIPWDVDLTLESREVTRSLFHNFEKTRIALVVRDTPALQARYREKVAAAIATLTHPDQLGPRIDFIFQQIREAAHADPYKRAANDDFDTYPDTLKWVIQARYDSLRSQLGAP